MRRQGSGFGFVVLLVVVAIVLFLATRLFKSALPAAGVVLKPSPASEDAKDAKTQQGGEAAPSNRIPNLRDAKRNTDAHAAQVKDALEKSQQ
jgi:hypothetical protein